MPFIYKINHFAKTGSGQTLGNHSKKDAVFRTVLSLIGRRLSEQVGRCADRALNRESLGILLA
jgi:hypothetical protein